MKSLIENGMEYFQAVLQSSPVGMLVFDENRKIVFINSVAEGLFDKTEEHSEDEQLQGKRCGDFLHCLFRHKNCEGCGYSEECADCPLDQTLRKAFNPHEKRQSFQGEAVIRREEQYFPNFIRYKANTLEVDGKRYAVLAMEDITAQKTTELRLKRTQEIGQIGSWELDMQKNILTWSDETFRLFGYVPQTFEATYEAFLEVVHPEDREEVDTAYTESVKQSLDGYEIEHRIIRKDTGEIRILHEKCEHNKDDSGKIIRSEGMVQDITERKKAEEALKKSEERYRALFEKSAQGVILHDSAGTILEANQAALDIFGYRSPELKAMHPRDLVHAEERESVLEDAERIDREDTIHQEHRCIRKDGKEILVTLRIKMIAKDLIQVIIQDVTLERKLEQHKEDVDRIMRHDLKTPLNGIINLPHLIASEDNVTEEQKEILSMIEEAGRTMLTMIDTSLDMFKMETGKYIYEPSEIDAVTAAEKVIDQNESRLQEKDLECEVLFNDAPLEAVHTFLITSEATLFQRMFSNLFINALEASPPGETIIILFEDRGNKKIIIRNKGTVPESIRPVFFEKYSTHGKPGGTGIGTYSAKLIADTLGHSLTMETSDKENATWVIIHNFSSP